MSEVAPQTEDKATPAPQPDAPIAEIEIVDTPVAPEVTPQAQPAPAPLIAGKFRTPEEAAKAYEEAQRMMHEKAQEAATYRKMLEEQAARPQPAYQAPSVDIGEKFRERLAEDPFGTLTSMIDFRAKQMMEQKEAAQRELVKKYQSFSSRPEYASVAQQVAAELPFANQPIDPVEGMFLRKRLEQLEAMVAQGAASQQVNVPFVEPASGSRRAAGSSLRVELDPDTAKMRQSGDGKLRDLARIVAKQKVAGGTMREMSIDDWEKANA